MPLYAASILVLLGTISLLIATPVALALRPLLLIGLFVALAAFQLPFMQSAFSLHAERASLWVHQADWERRQHADPRRWTPSASEINVRRKLLWGGAAWALLLAVLGLGAWVGDRYGVLQASALSLLCLALGLGPVLGIYLGFERRWARKADLNWQMRRVEADIESWEKRLAAPLGPLGSLPTRVPDNALLACFAVFLWLSFFAFLGAETGADAMQLLAFPAWASAGVAFLFGRDPSNARVF
ncbi:MAG: hypothetical protein WD557_07275 [Dehalococcoidia bacterium]